MPSEDWYGDGYNAGRGRSHLNRGHAMPQTDGDRYSYDLGREDGERHRRVAEELDRELYGDDYC